MPVLLLSAAKNRLAMGDIVALAEPHLPHAVRELKRDALFRDLHDLYLA